MIPEAARKVEQPLAQKRRIIIAGEEIVGEGEKTEQITREINRGILKGRSIQ